VSPDPWRVLGIAPTSDVRLLKKAYAARLKQTNPEDDAEGFQRLREAYEMALASIRWQEAHRDEAGKPRPSPTPPSSPRPSAPEAGSPRYGLRALDAEWTQEGAGMLAIQAERLVDDPEQRTSEAAWRALLANESLWNVDMRQRFERSLIELLLRRAYALTPGIWCQLEAEFHWSEQPLSFYRSLPRDAVDRLLERLEQAPLEQAAHLCAEARFEEARALLEPIASGANGGGPARMGAARRLLIRCAEDAAATPLLAEVERLRADDAAWRSTAQWRALLDQEALRSLGTRAPFQRQLFAFLTRRGHGLTGDVWRLLDSEFGWSVHLAEEELARGLKLLGPAIVEGIERLCDEGRHQKVVTQWARIIVLMEGDEGARGCRALERSCFAVLERAEGLYAAARLEIQAPARGTFSTAAPSR